MSLGVSSVGASTGVRVGAALGESLGMLLGMSLGRSLEQPQTSLPQEHTPPPLLSQSVAST